MVVLDTHCGVNLKFALVASSTAIHVQGGRNKKHRNKEKTQMHIRVISIII